MTTALYIRLSKADGDKPESDSIKGQRDLLTDFVKRHPELSAGSVLTFADDDYTGTNMNRPAMQAMLEQARQGRINCIVVKDFSRFARSSVDTNEYLELIFPFLNIRFISVTNNYDSDRHKGATAGFEAAVPALIAEMYSRDLSLKMKTANAVRIKRGECLRRPVYGYVKSASIKNAVEADPAAADVVRRIFSMAADGMTTATIAKALNHEGVDSPLAYRRKQYPGLKWSRGKTDSPYWSDIGVRRILQDEKYTGKLISGKAKRLEFGSTRIVTLPKSEWTVVDNAIPAIITAEEYVRAQKAIRPSKTKNRRPPFEQAFARKVLCGHCGYTLKYYRQTKYICSSNKYAAHEKCFEGYVTKDWLKGKVLEAYNTAVAASYAGQDPSLSRYAPGMDAGALKLRLKRQRQCLQKLKDEKKSLFEQFTSGIMNTEGYKAQNAELTRQLSEAGQDITELQSSLERLEHSQTSPQTASPAMEFRDDMMAYVKGIRVFDRDTAVVDIDLSGTGPQMFGRRVR